MSAIRKPYLLFEVGAACADASCKGVHDQVAACVVRAVPVAGGTRFLFDEEGDTASSTRLPQLPCGAHHDLLEASAVAEKVSEWLSANACRGLMYGATVWYAGLQPGRRLLRG